MRADSSPSLYDLTFAQLQSTLTGWGEPAFRAKQIWEWLYGRLAASYDAMTNLPKSLRDRLSAALSGQHLHRSVIKVAPAPHLPGKERQRRRIGG